MNLPDIDTIKADLAIVNIVETVDQVGDGCLTCTRRANEGDLLTGCCPQRDVVQNHLLPVVGEVDIFHDQLAAQTSVGNRSIAVGVAPCPHSRAFFSGMDIATFIDPRADQGHVALVFFTLLLHQGKDSGSTRKTQGDHRDLHRGLPQRLRKVTHHAQEGDDNTDGDCAHTRKTKVRRVKLDHDATDECDKDVEDISNVSQRRHEHIAELVSALRIVEELVVVCEELFLDGVFVVEDLDDLLAIHHFFDIAFLVGQ